MPGAESRLAEIKPAAYVAAGLVSAALEAATHVPVVVWALFALMAIDVVMDLGAAYITQTIDSVHIYPSMMRKGMTVMVVMASSIVAHAMPIAHFGVELPAGSLVAGMFCLREFISILENAGRAGIRLPAALRDVLIRLKGPRQAGPINGGG